MTGVTYLFSAILLLVLGIALARSLRKRGSPPLESSPTPAPSVSKIEARRLREEDVESEDDGGDEGERRMTLLGKFSHAHEAELARAALESADIEAVVQHGHGAIVGIGTWVTLWVPARDLDSARRVLAEESLRLELSPEEEAEEADMVRDRKISRGARYLLLFSAFCVMLGTVLGLALWKAVGEILVLYYGQAVVFAGLYFWARRSPLPALVTGAALFTLGQVAGFLLGVPGMLGGVAGGRIGYVVWTIVFLTAWGVAIREARTGRTRTGTP